MPEKNKTDWVGCEHCLAKVHCTACLGPDDGSITWRDRMTNGGLPDPLFNMLALGEPCPYGMTLPQAMEESLDRWANGYVEQFRPFWERMKTLGATKELEDAVLEAVSTGRIPVEVAYLVAEKMGLVLEAK